MIAAGGTHSVAVTGDGTPQITLQPDSTSAFIGTVVSFNALAAGASPIAFQWLHNGAPVSAGTAGTLSLVNLQMPDAGNYAFTASNVFGVATSAVATLTVLDSAPAILQQPLSTVISKTLSNQLSAHVEGSLPNEFSMAVSGNEFGGRDHLGVILSLCAICSSRYLPASHWK